VHVWVLALAVAAGSCLCWAAVPGQAAAQEAVTQAMAGALEVRVPDGPLGTPLLRLRSLLGLVTLLVTAWLLSEDRRRIPWRVVAWGIGLQVGLAVLLLRTRVGTGLFEAVNRLVLALLGYSVDGARFLFGNLVASNVPIGVGDPGQGPFAAVSGQVANTGAFFAFTVLPTIIFFSSLMAVLYHLGIMQWVVRGIAWVMQRSMGTSGAETLVSAGNIFVGLTEAPLLVRPFIERMTRSELMTVMTAGFATVAGGVMAAYVGMLSGYFPDIAGHLLTASEMSAPAAILVSKLMLPEAERAETAGTLDIQVGRPDVNVIDAAARGASEGLQLALGVGAMLLAFIGLIHLVNGVLGWTGGLVGLDGLTLEWLLGMALAPLTWLMGVPWSDAPSVAGLIGIKTVLNEFVAYLQLAATLSGPTSLEPRSVIIATYALCGFANFGSIAMQIGGMGAIAPSRRRDLAQLGLRAMVGGSLAGFMTATVAGMVL